jgi:hypothetical protein
MREDNTWRSVCREFVGGSDADAKSAHLEPVVGLLKTPFVLLVREAIW